MHPKIKIPRFARNVLHDQLRCRSCQHRLFETDVSFVGVSLDKSGTLRFSYEAECSHCKRMNRVIDATRDFTDANWWEEIGHWHEHALETMGPSDAQPWLRGAIRMLVAPAPLKMLKVNYGYKGDIGPVILYCYGSLFYNSYGSVRLERENRIRLLTKTTDENMPHERWWRLKKTPEGGKFVYAKREWTRLTTAELQDIVRDRVFTVLNPDEEKKAMAKSTKQARGPYEKSHAQKSSKRTRRSSRNARPLDS